MKDIIHNILKKVKNKAQGDIIGMESEGFEINFENNALKSVSSINSKGMGLRVIKDKRIGFSSTSDFNKPDELAANALASSAFGQEAKFNFISDNRSADVKVNDPTFHDFTMEKAMDIGKAIIKYGLENCPEAKWFAEINASKNRIVINNTAGLSKECEFTDFTIGVSLVHVRGESLLSIYEGAVSHKAIENFMESAIRVVKYLKYAENEVSLKREALPVIFTPKALQTVLMSFLLGSNGKNIQKGISPLIKKIGQKVLDKRVSIADNPSIDWLGHSSPFDMEGVCSRPTVLFDKGVFVAPIYDLQTAGMMAAESTSNGIRPYSRLPSPQNTNVVVQTGNMSLEKMLKDMKRGVLVDEVIGGGQSNILAGDFSVNIDLGFLIEDGEIKSRLKNVMTAGNAYDIFNNITAIGDKAYYWGNILAPYICFDSMMFVGD